MVWPSRLTSHFLALAHYYCFQHTNYEDKVFTCCLTYPTNRCHCNNIINVLHFTCQWSLCYGWYVYLSLYIYICFLVCAGIGTSDHLVPKKSPYVLTYCLPSKKKYKVMACKMALEDFCKQCVAEAVNGYCMLATLLHQLSRRWLRSEEMCTEHSRGTGNTNMNDWKT